MVKNDKRSPLKDKPLRNPGQSLDEQRDDLVDEVTTPLTMVVFLVILAGLEWWRYYFPQKTSPYMYTFAVLLGIGYAAFKVLRALPRLRELRQGRDGERVVGQFLEGLRQEGY